MTPVFALWAWVLLLLHQTGATAADPPSLGNTIEADLIFPHPNGRYPASRDGVPIVVGIQNAAVASRFGFKLRWQVLEAQWRNGEMSVGVGGGEKGVPEGEGAWATADWSTSAAVTKHLPPGNYTLSWGLGVTPYCEFGEKPTNATYELGRWLVKGELKFTMVGTNGTDVPSPPLSLLPGRKRNNLNKSLGKEGGVGNEGDNESCPSLMGVVNFASTALWDRPALVQTLPAGVWGGPDWTRTFEPTTVACAVTAPPTLTPGPCRATVDAGIESSVFEYMGWPLSSSRMTPLKNTTTTAPVPKLTARPKPKTTTSSKTSMSSKAAGSSSLKATSSSAPTMSPSITSKATTTSTPTTGSSITKPNEATETRIMTATERKGMDNNNMLISPTDTAADPASFPGFINSGVSLSSLIGHRRLMLGYAVLALLSLSV
ncbi:hypothetical protein PG995_007577 [Apiospora arundinis]|uniref:Fungal transcription factor n=1 Tax=Apiospora arundinis TaxID=335852 RepID=A0ABR2JG22_9PEZI